MKPEVDEMTEMVRKSKNERVPFRVSAREVLSIDCLCNKSCNQQLVSIKNEITRDVSLSQRRRKSQWSLIKLCCLDDHVRLSFTLFLINCLLYLLFLCHHHRERNCKPSSWTARREIGRECSSQSWSSLSCVQSSGS